MLYSRQAKLEDTKPSIERIGASIYCAGRIGVKLAAMRRNEMKYDLSRSAQWNSESQLNFGYSPDTFLIIPVKLGVVRPPPM
jgi:hypothetical protein